MNNAAFSLRFPTVVAFMDHHFRAYVAEGRPFTAECAATLARIYAAATAPARDCDAYFDEVECGL